MNTPFLDFKPAEVKRNKEVYVAFYVLDPTNEKLKRIRIRCNRIKNRREQYIYASRLCFEINKKLYEGWNPLIGENPAAKKKVSLTESAIRYVRAKEKVLRKDSARSYRTKLTFFVKWFEKEKIANWLCGRFSTEYAAKLLDDYGSNERSAYSYNSMLQCLKGMFKWFLSEGLVKNNPFELFKGKRKEDKRRVTIPKQDRIRILNYFHKRGMTEYVAAIRLCFKYLIRPKEILMLQIKDLAGHQSLAMTERYLHISDAKRILQATKIKF